MELSLTEKGWWNGFYRWWKRSIWTKGQFNSIRSVEAFKCFVAWVAGNLRPDRLNNVAYRCISAPNVFPSFFVPLQNYPYHRNGIEVMILDFKYFIKTYFINDLLLFLSSKFKLDTFATICFVSLFRIYRAHIISRYTDNNAGTLIFQHPESIVFLFFFFSYSSRPDISKWIFLFFELRAKIFFLSFPFLFFPFIIPLWCWQVVSRKYRSGAQPFIEEEGAEFLFFFCSYFRLLSNGSRLSDVNQPVEERARRAFLLMVD